MRHLPVWAASALLLAATGCGEGAAPADVASDPAGSDAPAAAQAAPAPGPLGAADQAALDDPCSLLSGAQVRQIVGRDDYDDGSPGDALGEGVGGGSSCQWMGPVFGVAAERPPIVSVVVIPPRDGRRWTESIRASPSAGCAQDAAPGAGPGAIFEECEGRRELPLYVPARALDLLVAIEVVPPATTESVRPMLVQLAEAAAAGLR